MSALSQEHYFDEQGHTCGGNHRTLPEWLDRRPIDGKVMYILHLGGLPDAARTILVDSQGSKMVAAIPEGSRGKLDSKLYKERNDGAEQEVRRECIRRGIDFSRRTNQ